MYIQQEIECTAVSPDGRIVACVCSSGQVYMWRCANDACSYGVQLHPSAVALCGWLGATRVLGLAFCRAEPQTVEVAGLSSEHLLLCVLPGGLLRLLDTADGRCVGTVPARACSHPLGVVVCVLQDGRHAVIAGGGVNPVIVDLWQARTAAAVAVPENAQLLRLAAPRGLSASSAFAQQPSGQHHGAENVNNSRRAPGDRSRGAAPLYFAATSAESVFVWCWHGPGQTELPNAGSEAAATFTFKFARGRGGRAAGPAVALALEAGVLILGTVDRLLLWKLREDGAGHAIQVHREEDGLTLADLAGAQLVQVPNVSTSQGPPGMPSTKRSTTARLREVAVASNRPRDRRPRSWSPTRSGASNSGTSLAPSAQPVKAQPSLRMLLVAWTAQGEVLCSPVGESLDEISTRTLLVEPWGSLPEASFGKACVDWWSCGDDLVGMVRSSSADALCVRATSMLADVNPETVVPLPTKPWTRLASLEELWQPCLSSTGVQVACATMIEVRRSTWVVLGLISTASVTSVCAVQLSSDAPGGAEDTSPVQLPLPEDSGEPICLTSVGLRFLALGDAHGLLCWWNSADWRLAGSLPPTYRVPVVHLARVWSPAPGHSGGIGNPGSPAAAQGPDDGLAPEAALLAVLDELGRCRLVDLEAGEVLCEVQSQSGPRLWLDEPLRVTYDRVGRYLFAATPSYACVWDSGSGCFEGSIRIPSPLEPGDDAPASGRRQLEGRDAGHQHESAAGAGSGTAVAAGSAVGNAAASTPGFRCSTLRCPGFGIDAVPWQASASVGSEAASADRRLGDVPLDGPLWRLPLLLYSPSQLVSRLGPADRNQRPEPTPADAQVVETSLAEATPGQVAPPEVAPKAAAVITPPVQGAVESSVTSAAQVPVDPIASPEAIAVQRTAEVVQPSPEPSANNALAPAVPAISNSCKLAASLASIGLRLPSSPFVVGVIGIDDSISIPLPRRLGPSLRTAPARAELWPSDEQEPACMATASRALLEASLPGCSSSPHVVLALIIRTLLQSDPQAAPQVLQRWALPALRQVLREAPLESLLRALGAWTRTLHTANSNTGALGEGALQLCTFGSRSSLRDAAAVLMALVAHLEPWLFDRLCPSATSTLLTEVLCQRMFTRSSRSQLQSISCEVVALAFPRWRQHLARALPRRPGAGRAAAPAVSPEPRRPTTTLEPQPGHRPSMERSNSPEASDVGATAARPNARGPDEDLEFFTVQVLALYQEPRVAPSCLSVMMQVGAADPITLLHVMGKAARRVDMGAAYASSALLVLVAFIHRFAVKVLPLLPKFTEAVLRCLEPSDPQLRRQSLLAVTSALHELVQTFPMVAFHQPSQKFAVGTGDGLVIVYDLRTATKWRILEGHTGAIAGLAFARDGGQLASYSARDCSVRLWQCSSQGFLGGLLGTSGRCLRNQGLPPAAPIPGTASATAAQAANASLETATSAPGGIGGAWRTVSLAWTDRGLLRLVRESGETVHLRPE